MADPFMETEGCPGHGRTCLSVTEERSARQREEDAGALASSRIRIVKMPMSEIPTAAEPVLQNLGHLLGGPIACP